MRMNERRKLSAYERIATTRDIHNAKRAVLVMEEKNGSAPRPQSVWQIPRNQTGGSERIAFVVSRPVSERKDGTEKLVASRARKESATRKRTYKEIRRKRA